LFAFAVEPGRATLTRFGNAQLQAVAFQFVDAQRHALLVVTEEISEVCMLWIAGGVELDVPLLLLGAVGFLQGPAVACNDEPETFPEFLRRQVPAMVFFSHHDPGAVEFPLLFPGFIILRRSDWWGGRRRPDGRAQPDPRRSQGQQDSPGKLQPRHVHGTRSSAWGASSFWARPTCVPP